MSVWNTAYSSNPPDDNNPGYGAAAIRDLKTNIQSIVGNEHDFTRTSGATATQGQHEPGSAICDFTNGADQDGDYTSVNNGQVGRLTATTTETTDTNGDAVEKTTMKVNTYDDGYVNIQGHNQVSLTGDETIYGEKIFNESPIIPVLTDTELEDAADGTIATIKYVKTETEPSAIEFASSINMGPSLAYSDYTYNGDTLYSKTVTTPYDDLASLITSIQTELASLRASITAVAGMSPYGQDLRKTASPTFNVVTADTVYGAVWG